MNGFDVFDPSLDLKKNYFLEASAGTGKTFTIENIVVRLLNEGMEIDQILIVTFTRAATLELKMRIRKNLEEKKLRKPLGNFDEAQIFTIHGFCFHLLKEFSLETGFPLNQHEESVAPIKRAALLKDFLRTELNPQEIHPRQLEKVLKKCQGSIEKLIKELMLPQADQGRAYSEIESELRAAIKSFPNHQRCIDGLIDYAPRFGGLCDRKRQLKPEHEEGFYRFKGLLEGHEVNFIDLPLLKMVPENLIRKQEYPPLLQALQHNIIPLLSELSNSSLIMGRMAQRAQSYVEKACDQEDLFFYDDLLKQIAHQIETPSLCEKIRLKYKTVLIDEFQDTDSLQWKIFSHLFLNQIPLYMIGDPKQSIYRFRGADLYTYREVKERLGTSAFATLNRNFRSIPALIDGLNTLFSRAHDIITLPKLAENISITPIIAGKASQESGGIIFCQFHYEEDLFSYILEEIECLHRKHQIPYKEFALLVKDRYQAKRFTSQCHLPFINKRSESLIDSDAFVALEDLLLAIRYPRERNLVVKALGGPLFGFTLAEVITGFEEKSSIFFHYQRLLDSQGLISLFYHLRQDLIFPNRSFYLDCVQLIELIAEGSPTIQDILPFIEKLKHEDPETEILKSRSKCDEDAIQVMTIHASKGLEFDVVFPIGLLGTMKKEDDDEEAISEKMRQLYVALTRAKRFLYLPISNQENTPMYFFMSKVLQEEDLETFVHQCPQFSLAYCEKKPKQVNPPSTLPEKVTLQEEKITFPPCTVFSFTSLAAKNEVHYVPVSAENQIPPGADTGILLHHIFEHLDFKIGQKELKTYLEHHLKATHLENWLPAIEELINNTLYCRLETPLMHFSLADIDPKKIIREMEFVYPTATPTGFLKGYIDLFFEYQNHFYIIDWKSNILENYSQSNLEHSIRLHQYDLQAQIYAQAARHYLKIFNSEARFAGTFYLFLRGLNCFQNKAIYYFAN